MGPIILILLHMSSKDSGRNSCCSWVGGTFAFPAMPPALLSGGRQPFAIQSNTSGASIAAWPHAAVPRHASGQVTSANISQELPWLQVGMTTALR